MIKIPGRIPIQIYPVFIVMVIALSMLNSDFQIVGAFLWAIVICVSLLIHELGHALTAIACGQKASIDLVGFGGVTKRHGPHLKPLQEFIIVLNGPLAGFMLAILSYAVLALYKQVLPAVMIEILQISVVANLFWTVINLLPVQPLDGGQLLRITLEGLFGLKGLKTALFISFVSSLAISVYFFTAHMTLIGAFFFMFTYESYQAWRSSLKMIPEDKNHALQQFLKSAERDFHKGHLSYAQDKLNIIRKQAEGGVLYNSASTLLAKILNAQGRFEEAYALLLPLKDSLPVDMQILLHQLAYNQKHWQQAIEIGKSLYQNQPSYQVALTNALCHAHLNQPLQAVGWIQCALKNGLPNIVEVLQKSDFDAIRNT